MAETNLPEEWRPVPGFADYAVSNLGRVRRETATVRIAAGTILTITVRRDGYHAASLSPANGQRHRLLDIHVLVCAAWHGPRPSRRRGHYHAAHWDGDKANNRPQNLRWATAQENNGEDRQRHGRTARGERNGYAVLSELQVREARSRLARGESLASVARVLGVAKRTVFDIKHGRTWAWLL